jgi:hypothetical protein
MPRISRRPPSEAQTCPRCGGALEPRDCSPDGRRRWCHVGHRKGNWSNSGRPGPRPKKTARRCFGAFQSGQRFSTLPVNCSGIPHLMRRHWNGSSLGFRLSTAFLAMGPLGSPYRRSFRYSDMRSESASPHHSPHHSPYTSLPVSSRLASAAIESATRLSKSQRSKITYFLPSSFCPRWITPH